VTAWTAIVVLFALVTDFGILHPLREWLDRWRSAGLPFGVKR
jgi:NitT/TauT family transport system permease protein